MTSSADRLQRSIFLLTVGFLFSAAVLRSVLTFAEDPYLAEILALLLAWLALFVLEAYITPRFPQLFSLYMALQAGLVVAMLARADSGDFYAVLFGVLSMQAMQRLGWKMTAGWIVFFIPLTALPLTLTYGVAQALAFALMYCVVNTILAFFVNVTQRAGEARAHNQVLVDEVRVANRELEASSRRAELLATAEERHRLARELHDSVTQTVFTMNLTAQSAALLLPRDGEAAAAQLEQLEALAEGALAEIRAMGSELVPAPLVDGGLAAALRRHVAERALPGELKVTLAVEGDEKGVSPAEELCLYRIAQEALNNVAKHARAREAAIRLRLSPPRLLQVDDDGVGFDPPAAEESAGMGLAGMRERAAEIGWSLHVASAPGAGTRVVVEQGVAQGHPDEAVPEGRLER